MGHVYSFLGRDFKSASFCQTTISRTTVEHFATKMASASSVRWDIFNRFWDVCRTVQISLKITIRKPLSFVIDWLLTGNSQPTELQRKKSSGRRDMKLHIWDLGGDRI
jgi:hypothetical protein